MKNPRGSRADRVALAVALVMAATGLALGVVVGDQLAMIAGAFLILVLLGLGLLQVRSTNRARYYDHRSRHKRR